LAQEGYEVNAWFLHDWKPLLPEEIERGLTMLAWSRQDLLAMVQGWISRLWIPNSQASAGVSVESCATSAGQSGGTWIDTNGSPREEVPEEPSSGWRRYRPADQSSTRHGGSNQVIGVDGEIWSPRKLLRRAVWHERDHTAHIQKLKQRD